MPAPVREATVFESPLPGVVGRPIDRGVTDSGGKDTNTEFWATRTMECRVGENLFMVVHRCFSAMESEADADDYAEESSGWWVGAATNWYLCTDANAPDGTAIHEMDGDYNTDGFIYESLESANAEALRWAGEDEEWINSERDDCSLFFPGGNKMRERVIREAAIERALNEAGIKRHNKQAIAQMLEMGVDLLNGELPEDENLAHVVLAMSPNLIEGRDGQA